jgi:F0F1-type ATP synthase assembly protein I
MAESFTTDYRAEIKAEIMSEMKAEQETLNSEQETSRFEAVKNVKEYATPIVVGATTILGLFALRMIK